MKFDLSVVECNRETVTTLEKIRFRAFGIDYEPNINDELINSYANNFVILAVKDVYTGKMVAGAYICDSFTKGFFELERLFVEPEYKGMGIGRLIIKSLRDYKKYFIEKLGYDCDLIGLESLPTAEKFYEKLNFHKGCNGKYFKVLK